MNSKNNAIVRDMSGQLDWKMLMTETRPRVYLLWAFLTGTGYTATHYYQNPNINIVWTVIALIGLGYMYRTMPLRVGQMRNIFRAWLVPISFGIAVSVLAVRTSFFPELAGYLGAFWLLVSAVGYAWNGLVDPPSHWYYIAAITNVLAGAACYLVADFTQIQYLIAALVSVWSMLSLWIFRSDA